jgi:hypothetical protein
VSDYTVAIVQSSYIPWKGYFDLIGLVDEFVLFDDRQFTRRDWRNRNRIKTAGGTAWITLPVLSHGRYTQRIDEVGIADSRWADKHLKTISQAYAGAPFADELHPWLEGLYAACAEEELLSRVNYRLIRGICELLGIETPLSWSTDYSPTGDATERLLSLCKEIGADRYLSGPTAQGYLEVPMLADEGIEVMWMDYSGYEEYPQLHGAFDHQVSIIDLLLNVGPREARKYLKTFSEASDGS